MVTVCREFRDPHKEYTDPGEYCTIEFTWFQLKKNPVVFKIIKINTVLFEILKFCILAFRMSLFSMQSDKELNKLKKSSLKRRKTIVSFLGIESDIRSSNALFKRAVDPCKSLF